MILLDTNTLIYCLKGLEPVTSKVQAADPREVAIPSIVACELEYGTLKAVHPRRRAIIEDLLRNMRVIPFDADAANEAARIRINLEARGLIIGPLDLLIAATAVSRGAVLVTNNRKEFSRVRSLRLADWTE